MGYIRYNVNLVGENIKASGVRRTGTGKDTLS